MRYDQVSIIENMMRKSVTNLLMVNFERESETLANVSFRKRV